MSGKRSTADHLLYVRHTTDGQILITSQDLLKRDVEYYKNIVFAGQVIDYYMLTGSVNKEKCMQMVDSFNKDDVPVSMS